MIKCHICSKKFSKPEALYEHYLEMHDNAIPEGWSPERFYYFGRTGKSHGSCVVCHKETDWNDSTDKYHRFCKNPKCKDMYREEFKKRMIGKYGKVHLLSDPEQQRKMLKNRKISGEYEWSDGVKKEYVGSYEKEFLMMADSFLNFSSEDIMTPSPHTYYYEYEGETKFYIPDMYICSINCEVEIKDGGDNPNNHHKIQEVDKKKEQLKDNLMMSQKNVNYVKLTNKKYNPLFELLDRLKNDFRDNGKMIKTYTILGEAASYMESIKELQAKENMEMLLEQNTSINKTRLTMLSILPKINTEMRTFDEVKTDLEEMLMNIETFDEYKYIQKQIVEIRKRVKRVKSDDKSLEYEVNKFMQWLDRIYINNLKIRGNYLIKKDYLGGR